MRKVLLPLLAAAALVGGTAASASAAPYSVELPASVQKIDYYGGDWRAREWHRHEREEWRRREAWRQWHRAHEWR